MVIVYKQDLYGFGFELSYTENDVDGSKDLNNYPIDFILEMIGDGKFVIKIQNTINLNEDDNTITISRD